MTQGSEKPSSERPLREITDVRAIDTCQVELMRQQAFEHMVARGLADARAGRSVDHVVALGRIRSWR
jgi:predicted transcriptional regulator